MIRRLLDDLEIHAVLGRYGEDLAEDFRDLRAVEYDPFWEDNNLPMPRHWESWIALAVKSGLSEEQASRLNRFQILGEYKKMHVDLPRTIDKAYKRKDLQYRLAKLLATEAADMDEIAREVYGEHECDDRLCVNIKKAIQRINVRVRAIDPRVRIESDGVVYFWSVCGRRMHNTR